MPGRQSKGRRAAGVDKSSSSRSTKRPRPSQQQLDDPGRRRPPSQHRGRRYHHANSNKHNKNTSEGNISTDDVNAEILEQLQRQRKQQQQEQQRREETTSPKHNRERQDEDEQEISSHTPLPHEEHERKYTRSIPARKHHYPFANVIGTGGLSSSSPPTHASVFLSHGICSHPLERQRLVSLFGSRRSVHSCRSAPSAVEFQSGYWTHLLAPMVDEDNVNQDLYGLLHQPPWSRTFDVWPYRDTEPPQIISTGTRDMSARDVHRAMRVPVSHLPVITCRYRALPRDLTDRASIHFDAVARHADSRRDTVRTFRLDYSTPQHPDLKGWIGAGHPMVNDLCYLNPSRILLAPLYRRNHPQSPYLPVIVLLDSDGTVYAHARHQRPANSRFVPCSDALCIEADYPQGMACMGFRNGQLVVTDLEGNTQAATSRASDRDMERFGSVHALTSLGSRQMLARGSAGTCRLFDLRKLSCDPTLHQHAHASAVVTEYTVPEDQVISERLTRKCRGVATDPSRSTVLSPIVVDDVPALAMWSAHTGEYVGYRALAPHPDSDGGDVVPSTFSWGVSWVELCARVTTAWDMDPDDGTTRRRPGSFALWYKTGMSYPGPSLPESAGKIHQAVFDGRPSLAKDT